jgi:hypothetical protein
MTLDLSSIELFLPAPNGQNKPANINEGKDLLVRVGELIALDDGSVADQFLAKLNNAREKAK